jgi:hypothetical protein
MRLTSSFFLGLNGFLLIDLNGNSEHIPRRLYRAAVPHMLQGILESFHAYRYMMNHII